MNNCKDYEIKKFADKLKHVLCLLIGCTREQLEDEEFKNTELPEEWDKYKLTYSDGFDECVETFNSIESLEEFRKSEFCQHTHHVEIVKQTPRLLLQLIGTECGREMIHENIWVNSLFSEFKEHSKFIITDVRFRNEAEEIKRRGGILIRVNRDIKNPSSHESETALDDYDKWDYIINNNGTLEELYEKVQNIIIHESL